MQIYLDFVPFFLKKKKKEFQCSPINFLLFYGNFCLSLSTKYMSYFTNVIQVLKKYIK